MAEINIRGDIISNDDKWIYDWLEWDSTCPADVKAALDSKPECEMLMVLINSGGGSVFAGQEIYSMLRDREDVQISIQSLAGSAASVIAMANKNEISPVGMIMIHNVRMSGAAGDYHDMKKNAEILQRMNEALAAAYVEKTGRDQDEILRLMDKETWLTANQALELGFVDSIDGAEEAFAASVSGMRLTEDIRQQVIAEKAKAEALDAKKHELLNDLDSYGI